MQFLSLAVLTVFLLFTAPATAYKLPFDSVQPLAWDSGNGIHNHCTAWATQIGDYQFWVSAAHCAMDDDGNPDTSREYYIKGKRARLATWNGALDVAFFSGISVKPLSVSVGANLDPLTEIIVIGYPQGVTRPFVFKGTVVNGAFEYEDDPLHRAYAIYQVPVAGAGSGSPVFDQSGMVVGMWQAMTCAMPQLVTYCPVSVGITVLNLQKALAEQHTHLSLR